MAGTGNRRLASAWVLLVVLLFFVSNYLLNSRYAGFLLSFFR